LRAQGRSLVAIAEAVQAGESYSDVMLRLAEGEAS